MASLLKVATIPAVSAERLPDAHFLLTKGTTLDCTLVTAIDTSLPGFTACVIAMDVYSADGSTVLLERGTKLFGETRNNVSVSATRVFVLWTEARSPSGVVATLASPATDELGRSGLVGDVNRHFFERFGLGILTSVVDGVVNYFSQSRSNGVVLNTAPASAPMNEALRNAQQIPPTVSVPPGAHIQVLVARDVSFANVYGATSNDPR
jgi:type IV secretion system protein VirB10